MNVAMDEARGRFDEGTQLVLEAKAILGVDHDMLVMPKYGSMSLAEAQNTPIRVDTFPPTGPPSNWVLALSLLPIAVGRGERGEVMASRVGGVFRGIELGLRGEWRSGGWATVSAALIMLASLMPERVASAASFGAVTPLDRRGVLVGVALSADGRTVVGSHLGQNREFPSFRWTRADGFRDVDELGSAFRPGGVSGDGSRIVGSLDGQPVVWHRDGSLTALALPVGGTSGGTALGVSDDGRFVVGRAHDGGVEQDLLVGPGGELVVVERPREVPVVWSIDAGTVIELSETSGAALDVSNDGVVVGNLELPTTLAERGFRWDQAAGLQFLPAGSSGAGLPWAMSAPAISTDGRSIVGLTPGPPPGSSGPVIEPRAYRWDGEVVPGETLPADGLLLIDLPGFPPTVGPTAVSADGSTVVGTYRDGLGQRRAFSWTETAGFRDLQVLLSTLGIATADWILTDALDVSADGRTIVGQGRFRNSSGPSSDVVWIAVIPEPSTALLLGAGLSMLAIRPRGRSAERRPKPGA